MTESEANFAKNPIYLQRVDLDEVCYLQEVLYWVAFGRLPTADDARYDLIEGYKTNVPLTNGELTEEECESAGLPLDPRLNYSWAWDVMLSDQIEEIVASRELLEDETEQDESIKKEQARREAAKLLKEMKEWKPKFDRAIEIAACKVYLALREGRLTCKGRQLPDLDVAVSLKLLADQNKELGKLEEVAIPNDFWWLQNIYWEISAARNQTEHYCHIYCATDDVMAAFPLDTVTTGEPVHGLVRHGSFCVLSPDTAAAATSRRRSKARGRVGAHPKYRWDDLHLEMAGLVATALPAKKEATVEHLREVYRKKHGEPVPSIRTLYDWVKPYYQRYCGNSDR
jgi:hypothetical protein